MARKKKAGASAKFGPRYGMRTRRKWLEVDKRQRALHECPVCNRKSVKRIASGIWMCNKCSAKFTGGAYSPVTGVAKTVGRVIKRLSEGGE